MYRKIQKETVYPNGYDYLYLSELPEKFCMKIKIFIMNFKRKYCKHLVVYFVKVLLEILQFFLLNIPYYHPIFAVSLYIKSYLSKDVQYVYFMMGKFFSYTKPLTYLK